MSQWNDPQGRQPESWESQPTQYIPPGQYGQGQGQPQFGQQPYGAPGQPPRQNPFGAESNDAFGIAGTVCALLGFVVLIVALTSLDWFSRSGVNVSFSDVHDGLSGNSGATGFADAYFSWLAWTFAVIGTLAAVGSCFPSPAVRALRIIGTVVGVAAAGLSFLAIRINDAIPYSEYIKDARAGFYAAVIGFLLVAVGAAIGPRKV